MNDSVNRYWDNRFKRQTVKILPGDYYVCDGQEMIVTVLGSCISACIQDQVTKIGGMNHFMLPTKKGHDYEQSVNITDDTDTARYGNVAMERLINDIVKLGGNRHSMRAKIFGGGRITNTRIDIGAGNISFVHEYLHTEGIQILSEDVGNIYPRKVYYIPEINEVYVKIIQHMNNTTIIDRDISYIHSLDKYDTEGQVSFL
ncbi:MAG: chemoreceptor glutamine deamidase CheD [Gammaproteobacteria bacterium]|nr:chemoreceptor glutamine deamidase CheD [Gammaproteobacteria bacterium]